jgi:hypothetical protein
MRKWQRACGVGILLAASLEGTSQTPPPIDLVRPGTLLDPSQAIAQARTVGSFHTPLPEEYIWTANDAAVETKEAPLSQLKRNDWKVKPHYFRREFTVDAKPEKATLYIAGPREAKVWINGMLVAEMYYQVRPHMGFGTMTADVSSELKIGQNVIAIQAVRGYGSHHHSNAWKTNWLNSGEVLAVKIIPAAKGVNAALMLASDKAWKSAVDSTEGWQRPDFDDAGWKPVVSLGGIESSADFFQWNADMGMYAWPGYLGEAPYMANYHLGAVKTDQRPEGLLLDFGRELNGRILLRAGPHAAQAHVRYGESIGELLHAPYLGEFSLDAQSNSEARGPKSAFRYALVHIDNDSKDAGIVAEGVYYPVTRIGNFESSDARLNKIWETAVYTAHLSMQDSILDGIKRDRGRWIGDDEVINRVIADVFGDNRLVKAALEDAIGPSPVTDHVNGLPGYSAWWVIAEAEYVRRRGDLRQLQSVKARLLELLPRMERELDTRGVYVAASGAKPFVDWAKDLSADSSEARRATHFEYMLAFRQAAWLLHLAGDEANASKYGVRADAMTEAAQKYLKGESGAYGDRWQTNAIAVLASAATSTAQRDAIWKVLARTVYGRKPEDVITPYYGSYLLSAMAELGHRKEALDWMRAYWGGMLVAGATSFWEAWDPAWAGEDSHARLEADGKVGYNASLAHGWASGPAAWLLEEVLGVRAVQPGFGIVQIRPDIAGLDWARGAIATPLGAVHVEASAQHVFLNIPPGMEADILLPVGDWTRNGVAIKAEIVESGTRDKVRLRQGGQYAFVRR